MKVLMLRCSCGAAVEFMRPRKYKTKAYYELSFDKDEYESFADEHLSHGTLTLKTEEIEDD